MTLPRATIIGAGFMGGTHTEALRRNGIEINGILSIDLAESRSAAKRMRLPCAYTSLDEVREDPSVDILYLCTPNHMHFEQARQAILAVKHLLCEAVQRSATERRWVEVNFE